MINNRLYKIYQKKYKEKEFREKKKYGALYRAPEGGMLNIGEFLTMMEIKKDEMKQPLMKRFVQAIVRIFAPLL